MSTSTTKSKISLPKLRKDLAALAAGYRKHPKALAGIKKALNLREVNSAIKKFDKLEAREERVEKELAKIRTARNTLAAAEAKKVARTQKIVKAVLLKEDAKDFR